MQTTVLPVHRCHYPSHLDLFNDCRRRYRLQVIERRQANEPFSPALAKGAAAHAALEICCLEQMTSGGVPADLRALVAPRLPRWEYPTEAAWNADVVEVINWIMFSLSYIDPQATILGVERTLRRSYRPDDGSPAIPLAAKPDLGLLRTDRSGERFIEIIDWKTGKTIEPCRFGPVMARFAATEELIRPHFPGKAFAPTVFTEVYLAKQWPRSRKLTLGSCLEDLEAVKQTIAAIEQEQAWSPSPSPRCRWCPFNGNGCQPESAEDNDEFW